MEYKTNYLSNDIVFISGKIRFDIPLPKKLKEELNKIIYIKSKIIIGDAPGADKRVQEYLSDKKYRDVEVYTTDNIVRNNIGSWKVNVISSEGCLDEIEVRSQKDIAMANKSTKGIVIASEEDIKKEYIKSIYSATTKNIQRMITARKPVYLYDYSKNTFGLIQNFV